MYACVSWLADLNLSNVKHKHRWFPEVTCFTREFFAHLLRLPIDIGMHAPFTPWLIWSANSTKWGHLLRVAGPTVLNGSSLISWHGVACHPPAVAWRRADNRQSQSSDLLPAPKVADHQLNQPQSRRAPDILALRAKHHLVTTWSANVDVNSAQTEWGRCACADLEVGGAAEEGESSEPITAVSLIGWPPFTGCWHTCYIKETPPTAAPDKLDTSERGQQSREIVASPGETDTSPLAYPTLPEPCGIYCFHSPLEPTRKCTLLSADSVFCCLRSLFCFSAWMCKTSLLTVPLAFPNDNCQPWKEESYLIGSNTLSFQ